MCGVVWFWMSFWSSPNQKFQHLKVFFNIAFPLKADIIIKNVKGTSEPRLSLCDLKSIRSFKIKFPLTLISKWRKFWFQNEGNGILEANVFKIFSDEACPKTSVEANAFVVLGLNFTDPETSLFYFKRVGISLSSRWMLSPLHHLYSHKIIGFFIIHLSKYQVCFLRQSNKTIKQPKTLSYLDKDSCYTWKFACLLQEQSSFYPQTVVQDCCMTVF